MDTVDKEAALLPDPANPLAKMRKEVDIDVDFFTKYWMRIDTFDSAHAQNEYEQYMRYMKIILD